MTDFILPTNWDNIDEVGSNYFNLSLGAHILRINSVSLYTNKKNGNRSLKVDFDIDEGNEFDKIFLQEYDNAPDMATRKWPNEGTKYLSIDPSHLTFVKRFVKAVEISNYPKISCESGKKLDLQQFSGCLVGGIYGLEEHMKDGVIETRLNLFRFIPIKDITKPVVPEVKLLNGSRMPVERYKELKQMEDDEASRLSMLEKTFPISEDIEKDDLDTSIF